MKKAIKLTLAVALMLSASSLFAQKLGRINSQDILLAMPETKEMETNMQAFTKDLQDNLETISVEFNQKLTDYQKNYSTYSDSVRQLKERELQELQNRRQEFEQVAQQDIQKKQQELLTPIIEKAKAAIDKVAKDNGYLAIFETGSLAAYD
ncbi:MAG: OmpH family outer membrane protein, partial [Alistipes sp.]|nr:OmpH family outer membrane protein [Alistipes sp.]